MTPGRCCHPLPSWSNPKRKRLTNTKRTMKKLNSLLMMISSLFSVSSLAGTPDYKQTVPPPPPPECGTGWYFGLDGGANVYQDLGGTRTFNIDGDTVTTRTNHHVGGYGG